MNLKTALEGARKELAAAIEEINTRYVPDEWETGDLVVMMHLEAAMRLLSKGKEKVRHCPYCGKDDLALLMSTEQPAKAVIVCNRCLARSPAVVVKKGRSPWDEPYAKWWHR